MACLRWTMSSTNHPRLATAGLAALIAVFSPAASCDGGDRNQLGACPDQETCSPSTDDGLHFIGPRIGEGVLDSGEVKVLAVGGTQTIRLEQSLDGVRTPFDLAYDAAIDGTAATITSRRENTLVLRGGAPSDDYLRITDPADGTLYDRIRIESQPITQMTLGPTFVDALAGTRDATTMLFAPGSSAYVRLHAAPGYAVVDESMQISGSGVTQTRWDQVRLPNLAPGLHPITVVAGGQTRQIEITVVAGPDRLEKSWGPDKLEVGAKNVICYGSFLGTRYVHVPWSFSADNADVAPSYLEGCVQVTAHTVGTVVIHVRGAGLAIDHPVASVRAVRSKPAAMPDPSADLATAGERAATVREWMLESTK